MIQVKSVKQTIQLRGSIAPKLTIQSSPRQTVRLVSGGPRGPQGERGVPGPAGAAQIPDLLDGGFF